MAVRDDGRIGPFRVLDLIASGGQGFVYRAIDIRSSRKVALKVLRSENSEEGEGLAPAVQEESTRLHGSSDSARRFIREFRIIANLSNPHILPVYESGQSGDSLWISMMLVEGPSLRGLLHEQVLSPLRAASLTSQVAEALDASHDAGVLHRDVKPANVILAGTTSQHAYLCDFGIAKAIRHGIYSTITGQGQVPGTLDYLAPECWRGQWSEQSDIYALACVLYECLTGLPPFHHCNDQAEYYRAHSLDPVPPLSDLRSGLPKAIEAVVRKGLNKDVELRYQTAGELADAARDALSTAIFERSDRKVRASPPLAARPALLLREQNGDRHRVWDVTSGKFLALDYSLPEDVIRRVGRRAMRPSADVIWEHEGDTIVVSASTYNYENFVWCTKPRYGSSVGSVVEVRGELQGLHAYSSGEDTVIVAFVLDSVDRWASVKWWRLGSADVTSTPNLEGPPRTTQGTRFCIAKIDGSLKVFGVAKYGLRLGQSGPRMYRWDFKTGRLENYTDLGLYEAGRDLPDHFSIKAQSTEGGVLLVIHQRRADGAMGWAVLEANSLQLLSSWKGTRIGSASLGRQREATGQEAFLIPQLCNGRLFVPKMTLASRDTSRIETFDWRRGAKLGSFDISGTYVRLTYLDSPQPQVLVEGNNFRYEIRDVATGRVLHDLHPTLQGIGFTPKTALSMNLRV